MENKITCIALLRGINVGGHHKVPMAELREEMEMQSFDNVRTLLNSGNIIFDTSIQDERVLEKEIESRLENKFMFAIPVMVRKAGEILELITLNPFKNVEVTKDIRLYVSFLKEAPETQISLPWISDDNSFRIIDIRDKMICGILDLSVTITPKGMDALGQLFSKNITTRNWNTIVRISEKI